MQDALIAHVCHDRRHGSDGVPPFDVAVCYHTIENLLPESTGALLAPKLLWGFQRGRLCLDPLGQ